MSNFPFEYQGALFLSIHSLHSLFYILLPHVINISLLSPIHCLFPLVSLCSPCFSFPTSPSLMQQLGLPEPDAADIHLQIHCFFSSILSVKFETDISSYLYS